jgi:hypothetical protein
MQEFSFDFNDPVFEIGEWRLSVQVITVENTYGLPHDAAVERSDAGTEVHASSLTSAGGQRISPGGATIDATTTDDGVSVIVSASMPRTVRCTKLIVSGLPTGELLGHRWSRQRITRGGTTVHYPGTTHTALVFLALPDGEHIYFESLDDRVRAKRFAVMERDGTTTVELIHEDAATEMSATTRTPAWRIGRTRDPEAIVRRHDAHVAAAFGIEPWETRADVPSWAREVSLVVALHGMHWSGYIFNTYDDMRAAIEFVASRIEGRRALAFLPGWEGRYYWQYGDYRPEPMLGGDAGFARLAATARVLGVHLMPMFGANCVNSGLPGYAEWGAPAEMRSPSGLVFQGNRPDWDVSRAHDPGWQAWLNPGAPSWRARLVEQVSAVVATYDLPAVFLDTHHVWINDPHYDLYAGLVALRDELKARFPGLLVTGEGWYDALGAVTPMSHAGLPAAWPDVFAKYNRNWLHLSAGDPSRGSTGVHELGYSPFALAPDERHILPTLTVVDGALTRGAEGAERVIAQAREYARRWL